MITQLSQQLEILNQLGNASKIYSKNIGDLRERLEAVKDTLTKVQKSTKEMKDNTSNTDEDGFIAHF